MAEMEVEVRKQLKAKKVKRDVDVIELYLAKQNYKEVTDFSQFKNLQRLWLNHNKLSHVNCLSANYRLSELYLHDNHLKDITGSLEHLTCLEVLMLHNNQLEKLEKVTAELAKMQGLKVLNLFNNPLAQELEYRVFVVHHVPSVEMLDRHEVLKAEKDEGCKRYHQEMSAIKDSVAFGRRSEGPPSLHYPADLTTSQPIEPADYEVGNNFYRDHPPYATEDQAIKVRTLHRSIMEYTAFDWSRVPRSLQRRTSGKPFESPQLITTRFR